MSRVRVQVIPLVRQFPALARVPRVVLGDYPTPVESVSLPGIASPLWLKRDDLTSSALGGNKVRALEFLLAGVRPGDVLLTGGGEGSTHVLATAVHANRLGARVRAVRWRHEMHPVAERVAVRAARECIAMERTATALGGVLRALWLRARRRGKWIPFGGTSPRGILGHVNAALELADQVRAGALPQPSRVVVALGTGGTAAGLLLGFAAAEMPTAVIGARVVPRIASGPARVRWLARRTVRWVERETGVRLPLPARNALSVVHDVFGGAYGRVSPTATQAAAMIQGASGLLLDATYGAKAFDATLRIARSDPGVTLFWSTFDARWLR